MQYVIKVFAYAIVDADTEDDAIEIAYDRYKNGKLYDVEVEVLTDAEVS